MTQGIIEGDFVAAPDGRVGLVADIQRTPRQVRLALVRFGPDGPDKVYAAAVLRSATAEEVQAAGIEGVGGSVVEGRSCPES